MLQSFVSNPTHHFEHWKLEKLRQAIEARNLNAFLIPKVDLYRGEKLADGDDRLAWLTGFTGTSGFGAVSLDNAALFVDGRYSLEARNTVPDAFEIHPLDNKNIVQWLSRVVSGGKVGYCNLFHSVSEVESLAASFTKEGISFISSDSLIDEIWKDKPHPPVSKVLYYPEEIAGESHTSKRQRIAQKLCDKGINALLITNPGSIAWLLNLRGNDIPNTPVFHAMALLYSSSNVDLFIDQKKVPLCLNLKEERQVRIIPERNFESYLTMMTGTIQIDPDAAPKKFHDLLENGCSIILASDPCLAERTIKNETQIRLCREVQTRDAVAYVEFLTWFYNLSNPTELTEIDLAVKLWEFRQNQPNIRDQSFDTIVGSGPNGAIIHYRVKEKTSRRLHHGDLLLIDSGGQYLEGTTDLTRTLVVGSPTDKQRNDFTLVLKSLIAISQASWELGSTGSFLDHLAREQLLNVGEDYNHGTGHGVGQYLEVHEGPYSISKKNNSPIPNNILLSLEPGIYREGEYGIRIENLALTNAKPGSGLDNPMSCFETLTYVPIDLSLIAPDNLTGSERGWLNDYHTQTYATLSPRVSTQAQAWLKDTCRSI